MIPAEKKKTDQEFKTVVEHKHIKPKKFHPGSMARKKRAVAKKTSRKLHHTVEARIKSYKRKAIVKAHTRLVSGIGDIPLHQIGSELYLLESKINKLKSEKKHFRTIAERKIAQEKISVFTKQFKALKIYLNTKARFA